MLILCIQLMKSITRYILAYSAFFLLANSLPAQTIDTLKLKIFKPPHERVLFHEQVVTEQKNMLKYDGVADFKLEVSDNLEIN